MSSIGIYIQFSHGKIKSDCFKQKKEIDCHLYRKLYLKAKGNEFRNKRVLIEHIHTLKVENEREKNLQQQIEARRARSRRMREKKAAAAK